MPDDQFAGREAAYNNGLGQVIAGFCTAIVDADSAAKDAHTNRVVALLDRPNAEFLAQTSLIGVDQPLQTRVSVPALAITQANPIQIEEANLSLDMTVNASQEDTTKINSKVGSEASVRAGWGPVSAGVKITAEVSVGKETKRASDYRSTTHADVKMTQAPTPEGLMLILDSMNKTTAKGLEINQQIIEAKLASLLEQAKQSDDVAIEDKSGDGAAPKGTA